MHVFYNLKKTMTIRQAQFPDYTAIASLHADSWRKNYRGILSDQFLNHEVEKDRLVLWKDRFESPEENQFILLAEQDGVIIGFCCGFTDDDPVYGTLIDNLHVSSAVQRSGIGRALLQHAANYTSEKAMTKKMYLWVYESNHHARAAYEKMGGVNTEIVRKENPDESFAICCRIRWENLRDLT